MIFLKKYFQVKDGRRIVDRIIRTHVLACGMSSLFVIFERIPTG